MKKEWIKMGIVTIGMIVFCLWVVYGCAYQGIGVKGPNPFEADPTCTIYADMGIDTATTTAIIPKYILNPCAAQNIVVSVAKSGYALEAYQVEEFKLWVGEAKKYVAIGRTFGDIKLFIGAGLGKLNRKIGMMYFIVSDLMLVLPDTALVEVDDVRLIDASLDDAVKKVEEMASIFGKVQHGRIIETNS